MSRDYAKGNVKIAQRKLLKALKACEKRECSAELLGKLNLDLGVVYIAGLNKPNPGKIAFEKALEADPTVDLDPDLATPEVTRVFEEVAGSDTPDEPEEPATEDAETESEEGDERAPVSETTKPTGARKNWLSLNFQQELLAHSADQPACRGAHYSCFGPAGREWSGPIYAGAGDRTQGGLGLATRRVMLGYDRVLFDNLLAGLRLGMAFDGAPNSKVGERFLPLHAEGRLAYVFGDQPFEHAAGIRPYFGVGGGIAEVDGRLTVEYFVDQAAYQQGDARMLDAWRRAGRTFVAPMLGSAFAFGPASAITLEARLLFLFGKSGLAPAVGVGYALGL